MSVFSHANDPDYVTLLNMVAAGRDELERIKRFDMAGFRPRPEYLREMRRYGVLPPDITNKAPIDPYELDRRYWQHLWYEQPAE